MELALGASSEAKQGGSGLRATAVKICGLTRVQDAELAVDLGARQLGLNFWPGSARCVRLEEARSIAAAVGDRARLVGVFVNQAVDEVEEVALSVGLDLLQFHGDEEPEDVLLHGRRAIKVFRMGRRPSAAELAAYPQVWGYLFDRPDPHCYGGTGRSWRYDLVDGLPTSKPVLLAGGISPDNAGGIVSRGRPYGIDVCSGVERRPGVKDAMLMQRLFEEVRHAEAATSP
jgi:phosphoribosylanthranilate isomerase